MGKLRTQEDYEDTQRAAAFDALLSGTPVAEQTLVGAHPEAWDQIHVRRRFMRAVLGIELHPDVLPFSNLAAHLTPYRLRPDRAMTM